MTKSQRRKQNKLNAAKSTGPTSESGKERSRQNALKHGFTAVELTLPNETPETIQAEADRWFEAIEPATHDEVSLANQAALAALQLQRLTKASAATVASQVRSAEREWEAAQERKLIDMKELFEKDPARGYIELKLFTQGAIWLLQEWSVIETGFDVNKSFLHFETIRKALCLQGFNPTNLYRESFDAHEFTTRALACQPPCEKDFAYRCELASALPLGHRFEPFHAMTFHYDRAESVEILRQWIAEEIAVLRGLIPQLAEDDAESRATAKTRAMVPHDTNENRLNLRYAKHFGSSLDRSLKTILKLKRERENREEDEAEESSAEEIRNEPELRGKATANPVHPGSYVTINKKRYEVYDTSDGFLSLAPKEDEMVLIDEVGDWPDSGAVSTPENGV